MRTLRLAVKSRYTDVRRGRAGEEAPVVTREKALRDLLRPIRYEFNNSPSSKRNIVVKRHQLVRAAYPFMDQEERDQADIWFKQETHKELWDEN